MVNWCVFYVDTLSVYIYKTVVCACLSVCILSAAHISRRRTPRSRAVWRACGLASRGWHPLPGVWELNEAWTLAEAEKPGEHRRSTSKLAHYTHRCGPVQRSDRLNLQNPGEDRTSVFLRILRKRQRAIAQRSHLKKKDSFSCRHCNNCFPDFARAELEWLNHFRSCGRHFDWRWWVPFVRRREAVERSESLFVGLLSVLHRSCDSDLWVHFSGGSVNVSVALHTCGEEALMMPKFFFLSTS